MLLLLGMLIRVRFVGGFRVNSSCVTYLYRGRKSSIAFYRNKIVNLQDRYSYYKSGEGGYAECSSSLYTLGGILSLSSLARESFRSTILERFKKQGFYEVGGFYLAMFWGYKEGVDRVFLKRAMQTGVVHILVVSGYNVTLVMVLFDRLLSRLGALWRQLISLFNLFFWLSLVGGEPPIIRVLVAGVIGVLSAVTGYKFNKNFSWFLLLLGLIWLDPYFIKSLSLQLTLVAVWAVKWGLGWVVFIFKVAVHRISLLFYSKGANSHSNGISKRVSKKILCGARINRLGTLLLHSIREYLLTTLVVNLTLIPVFWLSGIKGNTSMLQVLLHNLLLLPVLDIIVPFGYIGLLSLFLPIVGDVFVRIMWLLFEYVRWVVFL